MFKLHLIDSLSICYTANVATNNDKSNTWNLGLSLSEATSAVGAINSCPPSATLCITAHRVALIIFSTSTVVHTQETLLWQRDRATCCRNSATYKTSHLKTKVPGLLCGIICRRTDRHTTTACTAFSIASRGKNRL